jgi:hypothetical protein
MKFVQLVILMHFFANIPLFRPYIHKGFLRQSLLDPARPVALFTYQPIHETYFSIQLSLSRKLSVVLRTVSLKFIAIV